MRRSIAVALATLSLACATPALAQYPNPDALAAAQKEAMGPLAMLDGVWRGPAWAVDFSGTRRDVTQTERIGPMLDGQIRVVEGRGYAPDGSVAFNAFGVMSYDPGSKTYSLSSWALGRAGDFPITLTADGYIWTHPAGPNAIVRYTTVVKDGTLHEVGEYVAEGQPPRRIFEMTLKRVGDTSWPAAGAVPKE